MTKRIEEQLNNFKYGGEPVRFRLGTLIVICLSVLLIIMATFTEIKFKHFIIPLDLIPKWDFYFTDNGVNWDGFIKAVKYIPQVPIIFFILGLLDRKYIRYGWRLEIYFPIWCRLYLVLYTCSFLLRYYFIEKLQIL